MFGRFKIGSRLALAGPTALAALAAGCDATLDPVGATAGGGVLLIEAEDYTALDAREGAAGFVIVDASSAQAADDPDPPHADDASGQSYVEALPDTFTAEGNAVANVSFFKEPGAGATLTYRVDFARRGRYFLWLRAYGGGAKDNTVFFGLDGAWRQVPAQVCGSSGWRWTNALRDETEGGTCTEERRAFVEVDAEGAHNLQFSIREDGFELDQIALSDDPDFNPGVALTVQ